MSGASLPRRPPATSPSRRSNAHLWGFLAGTALATTANGTYNRLVGPAGAADGHPEAMIGAIVAAGSVASLATRIPAGNAFRPERVTALVLIGSLCAAIGCVALPLVSGSAALALLSAVQGGGFALATTIGMAALIERRHPATTAGSLMGWYTGSIGAGYALAGFAGGALADAIGLGGARAAAAAPALAAGARNGWARRRLPIHRQDRDDVPPPRGWVRGLPPGVWLGASVAVYINVVNGGLNAFFPLYGLAIGLTLTQIGALSGVHATLASAIRFGGGTLLGRVSTRRTVVTTVLVIACGVSLLAATRRFGPLLALLAAVGLARGVLRVVSGAIVMDAAGPSSRHRGRASGVYLAGLDLGNAVGPFLGGVVSEAAGIRASFPVLGLASAALFLGVAFVGFRGVVEGSRGRSVTPEGP